MSRDFIAIANHLRIPPGAVELEPGIVRLATGERVRLNEHGGDYLDPPHGASSSAPLGKSEHDAVNAQLETNYAHRVGLETSFTDFVAWVEQRCKFPENRDQQEAWSQAVLELYSHRRT